MRAGLFLLVFVVSVAALGLLLWWRFRGSGKPAPASTALTSPRNHHSLRSFHYEASPTTSGATTSAAPGATVGDALARLLPAEDLQKPAPGEVPIAEPSLISGPAADFQPVSIRHAPGAATSLLDTLDSTTEPKTARPATALDEEEPAAALYYNPLTAPAPTANDQANRAAEIALRQQRRARMSAKTANQRTALSELFPGPSSPPPPA
ncbi:hypothetical protein H8B13_19725 [Hymenobacter sp. BT188]|uniref:hypothetical protein n=1 Tax=Hymenobacter sp. BT188 TaxID=2763504 RepID=UPI001650F148|nr:hypothetical protein [Hymenobacter sp. BT188]MBC6609058.1 hypothetical protein [Hymenobacter sp. BT188]